MAFNHFQHWQLASKKETKKMYRKFSSNSSKEVKNKDSDLIAWYFAINLVFWY